MKAFQQIKVTKNLVISRSNINKSIVMLQLNTPGNLNALTMEMGKGFFILHV